MGAAGRSRRSSPRTGKPSTWRRAAARSQYRLRNARRSPVKTDAPCQQWPSLSEARERVLGMQTVADRVVQASLVLVLEPIFEADFHPSSYGFQAPAAGRGTRSRRYRCSFPAPMSGSSRADITACFDEIDHPALMDRVRRRVGDKRVLALVKVFLRAGALSEDQVLRHTDTGTPQGGILSPLLANIALRPGSRWWLPRPERSAHRAPLSRRDRRSCRSPA
ncbi:reverse transcriptase domain-containing protein [Kribbella qitaiheensis]|uniref:reverse transcriptase domain-containing protein n=1 Tax=Kribbella qitaiheensis TaxID=1544730 RepID=UPI0036208267